MRFGHADLKTKKKTKKKHYILAMILTMISTKCTDSSGTGWHNDMWYFDILQLKWVWVDGGTTTGGNVFRSDTIGILHSEQQ